MDTRPMVTIDCLSLLPEILKHLSNGEVYSFLNKFAVLF
jgi:hypothetical protein